MAAAPGSRNFRPQCLPDRSTSTASQESTTAVKSSGAEQPVPQEPSMGTEDASSQKSVVAQDLCSPVSTSHISAEEIEILVEMCSRDNLEKSVKTTLLHKAIDQKIEGALKAERQRSSTVRGQQDGDSARLKKRIKELHEDCNNERAKVHAARAQAEEERRARTMAEAEIQRAAASEASKVAHMQSSLDAARHGEDAVKVQLREMEEKEERSRKELQEAKERLSGATVSQRLLRAYKAEKQRCQVDLEQTLRAFSDPAWQEEEQIEVLEASTRTCQAVLELVHGKLSGTRKHHVQGNCARQEAAVPLSLKSPLQSAKELHDAKTFHRPVHAQSVASLHDAVHSAARTSLEGRGGFSSTEQVRSDDKASDFPSPLGSGVPAEDKGKTTEDESACALNRIGEKNVESVTESKRPKDPSSGPQPLPPIPKKQKVSDKQEVIHIT